MADLISRWAAIDALTDTNLKRNVDSVCDGDMNRTRRAAQRVIAQLPAVDAVPVVRCKDCKYGEPDTNGNGEDMVMCHNKLNPVGYEDWLMPPEWFCADGELKEARNDEMPKGFS